MKRLRYLLSALLIFLLISGATTAVAAVGRVSPAAEYNPDDDQFVVAYSYFNNYGFGEYADIWGQRLAGNGTTPIGVEFEISIAYHTQNYPQVAYGNGKYLVVWDDMRSEIVPDIYGQLLNSDGAPIGPEVPICIVEGSQTLPRVAFDSTRNRFLVTWQDMRNFDTAVHDVYGQFVESNGDLFGTNFPIANGTAYELNPDCDYDSLNDSFLVAYTGRDSLAAGSSANIYCVRVSASDGSLGTAFALATEVPGLAQQTPALTFEPGTGKFMVAWENYEPITDPDDPRYDGLTPYWATLSGRIVGLSGPEGDTITITTGGRESSPKVAAYVNHDRYLVVWTDSRAYGSTWSNVYGQLVRGDGSLEGSEQNIYSDSFPISAGSIAYNDTRASFLVAYSTGGSFLNWIDVGYTTLEMDNTAPLISMTTPADGATNVAVDTNIVIRISDPDSGIDMDTIIMTVEGSTVSPPLPCVVDPLDSAACELTYNPADDFANNQEVNISVTAADHAGYSAAENFSFMTTGTALDPGDDEDGDGIPNGVEGTLGTDPFRKTLFVRPLVEGPVGTYSFWSDFRTLFPDPDGRAGFAGAAPFVNAGIEISVIGDPAHPYVPMRDDAYDPAEDDNHPPCDILEVYYMAASESCPINSNDGHTFFAGTTWSWDTKGICPNISASAHYLKYGYHKAYSFGVPLDNYVNEGAYSSGIGVGQLADTLFCGGGICLQSSPMNLDDDEVGGPPYNGLPDGTVEFNEITFDASADITAVGARGIVYDRDTVLKRTTIHEMGHAILNGLNSDHCSDPQCIMYHSVADWELKDFGPGSCTHAPGNSKDIRELIHNTVH